MIIAWQLTVAGVPGQPGAPVRRAVAEDGNLEPEFATTPNRPTEERNVPAGQQTLVIVTRPPVQRWQLGHTNRY